MLSAETLFCDFQSQIQAYIQRRINDPDITTDLTAETFCKATEAIAKGKGPRTSVSGWLYRVAHNLVIDYYRKRDRQPSVCLDEYPYLSGGDDLMRLAELSESRAKLLRAMTLLTDNQRQVIELRYLQGYSFAEIAHALGTTEGAVKALKHRALCSLQARMVRDE